MSLRYLALQLAAVFMIAIQLVAEPTSPKEVVRSFVNEYNQSLSPAVMVNYVHWPTAFNNLTSSQQSAIKVTNPEEFKAYITNTLKDPIQTVRKVVRAKMDTLTPEQRARLEQSLEQQIQQLEQQRQQLQEKMKNAVITVGEATIEGDKASVPVSTEFEGENKQETVQLERIDGRWYLQSSNITQIAVQGPR